MIIHVSEKIEVPVNEVVDYGLYIQGRRNYW